MFKNRSVTTNFSVAPSFLLNYQIPEEQKQQSAEIDTDNRNLNLTRNCDGASLGKSSTSSASWIEEDVEATKAVQYEFFRMQGILKGVEPIPPHYDHDEYELWMRTFPTFNLSITGRKLETSHHGKGEVKCDYEEIIAIDPAFADDNGMMVCDAEATSIEVQQMKSTLKSAVIEQIFTNVSNHLFGCDVRNKKRNYSNVKTVINIERATCSREVAAQKNVTDENLLSDLNSVLRISPVPLLKYSSESTIPNRENSILSRHFMTSKWLQDESPEYMSLPHLPQDITIRKNCLSVSAKAQQNHAQKNPKPGISAQVHYVTLPPIEAACSSVKGHFRSVSATPRCHSKSTSEIGTYACTPKHQRRRSKRTNRKTVNVNVDNV